MPSERLSGRNATPPTGFFAVESLDRHQLGYTKALTQHAPVASHQFVEVVAKELVKRLGRFEGEPTVGQVAGMSVVMSA